LIEIKDLEYTYKSGTHALQNINLQIKKGEFVAIVGHNGSGKSTLSKLMAGIDIPSRGAVLINEINTKDKSRVLNLRKTIGIVFQNPENQIVFEKVADDMAFGLKNLGVAPAEIDKRIAHITKLMKIEHFSDAFELSMGQKQRVTIAGVLAMQPECIIFDEPTAMLDPKGKKDIHNIIVDLHKQGLTIVYVTNVIDEVLSADRIIILSQGHIKYEFEKEALFDNVAKLKELGLETPIILDIIYRLKNQGITMAVKNYTIDALIETITRRMETPGGAIKIP
jgi:energy-coupling factor transport system ATP-binding protein